MLIKNRILSKMKSGGLRRALEEWRFCSLDDEREVGYFCDMHPRLVF